MKYVQDTHDPEYHRDAVEVQEIFEIVRGEDVERFKKFEKLHNRQLLWHGSNLTNFVGILSNGLKLASSDVEIHGKAFGNGIYFADAIAKSLHYCNESMEKEALLVLCEVALGDIHELTVFDQTLKGPPNGKHSVEGVGKQNLRPKIVCKDGILIPDGSVVFDQNKTSNLEFNEYIGKTILISHHL